MAIWRDEVEAAVNASVRDDTAVDTRLSVHVFLISQVNVVDEWCPATTQHSHHSLLLT